jgi:hypothetical protein
MSWLTELTGILAPFFIVMSPILSYSDQIISMHRSKSSAGFSLDIPLIMLVASFLRFDPTPLSRQQHWLTLWCSFAESFTGHMPNMT